MAAALDLFILGCVLLQGALAGSFQASLPRTIEVLKGSCVTIPCSFDVEDQFQSGLDKTCTAIWFKNTRENIFFDSSGAQGTKQGKLNGDLMSKDCTTTLNDMRPEHSGDYFFRLHCNNPPKFTYDLQRVQISVKDDPQRPTVTPSSLEVTEGTSVSLSCSAPAPCLSLPPALTWTPALGQSQETLEENQDKTKVKTSVLNFTASHLHNRLEISCTAVYRTQGGSTESSVKSSLTAQITYPPQILPSSDCTKNVDQLNCSCTTSGNPAPTLDWYMDESPANSSDSFVVTYEAKGGTGVGFIAVSQEQWKDQFTLLCRSSNSLGSAAQRFHFFLEPQTSAGRRDSVIVPILITTVVLLLVLVCALLFVIRALKSHHKLIKSQCSGNGSTAGVSQPLPSEEGKELVKSKDEDIYVNTIELKEPDVTKPSAPPESKSPGIPSSDSNDAEGARNTSGETNTESKEIIYSSVTWRSKSKQRAEGEGDDTEQKDCTEGRLSRDFMDKAMEMGNVYEEEPGNVKGKTECEYAQVKFKEKSEGEG